MRRAARDRRIPGRTGGDGEGARGRRGVVLGTGRADGPSRVVGTGRLDRRMLALYRDAIVSFQSAGVPFLVGGAYALAHYVGVTRHTRDFDVFVRRRDVDA